MSSSPSTTRTGPRWRWTRPLLALVVVAAATATAIACLPDGSRPRLKAGEEEVETEEVDPVITPDGTDRYTIERLEAGGVRVVAPRSNTGENLRQIVTGGAASSVDQEACMTWQGPNGRSTQPGLALRSAIEGDRTSALTISNNVYGGMRWSWNVHLADSRGEKTMSGLGLAPFPGFTDPFPWYLCARAVGSTLTIITWTDARPRPTWDGPEAHRVELPASMVRPGFPGLYIGHLLPGEAITFGDFSASTL